MCLFLPEDSNGMRYSIVIPTYNNHENLKILLASLDCQIKDKTFNFEVVVVDDGSKIPLENIITRSYSLFTLKIIRIERNAFSSRSRARNEGWKYASGKFIAFLDSDIVVKADYLKQLERYFSVNSNFFVIGNRIHTKKILSEADLYSGVTFRDPIFNKTDFQSLDYRFLVFSSLSYNAAAIENVWLHAYSCNIALSSKNLELIHGFDESFLDWGLEDLELAYRAGLMGVEFVINPYLEVLHQVTNKREDLLICGDKLIGYRKNIDYFMKKHPNALGMNSESAYLYLNGGMGFVDQLSNNGVANNTIVISNESERLKFLNDLNAGNLKADAIVVDNLTNSNIDLSIQSVKRNSLKYFPMDRVVDVEGMNKYLIAATSCTIAELP